MPDKREQHAVAEIQCPVCNAWPGKPCFIGGKPGRSVHGPACHNERRVANQERRRLLSTDEAPKEPKPL